MVPFLDPTALDGETNAALAAIAADEAPFDVPFEAVGRFADAVRLAPDPAFPFERLVPR